MSARLAPHFIRIRDRDADWLLDFFARTEALRRQSHSLQRHAGRIIGLLFYEPSTRTRLSFASAACRLGAQYLGFEDPRTASVSKGESLIDTIRVVQRYCDVIVLRHPADGSAHLAAAVALVPIVNGGDGSHEHPTQTLCDLYTICQQFGAIRGRVVGIMGDLRYGRTTHSLALGLASLGASLVCIAPENLQMPPHLLRELRGLTRVSIEHRLEPVIRELDVLYTTRLQKERMQEAEQGQWLLEYPLTPRHLARAHPEMLLLHPLPRDGEIAYELDQDQRARYFEQMANGVLVRMVLLDDLLTQSPPLPLGALPVPQAYPDPPWAGAGDPAVPLCENRLCVTRSERGIAPRYEQSVAGTGARRCVYCDFEYQREQVAVADLVAPLGADGR